MIWPVQAELQICEKDRFSDAKTLYNNLQHRILHVCKDIKAAIIFEAGSTFALDNPTFFCNVLALPLCSVLIQLNETAAFFFAGLKSVLALVSENKLFCHSKLPPS